MALPFFPAMYPDETFYSIVARYHALSGNIKKQHSAEDLFDKENLQIISDMPKAINVLSGSLNEGKSFTSIYFIMKHTFFPLFEPFLKSPKVVKNYVCRFLGITWTISNPSHRFVIARNA